MSKTKIHYGVLALTGKTVEEVICLEKQKGHDAIVKWLNENKMRIYGNLPEHWRPFGGDKIQNIIEQNPVDYHSETQLIASHFEGDPEALDLSGIDVFFIDIFSMYLAQYNKLASDSDQLFCSGQNNKCCFLIDYTLPYDIQKELEKNYKEFWPRVSKRYSDGCLHRVAARIDDLNNFRNYLVSMTENQDVPNAKIRTILRKTNFKDYPDKSIPNLLR